jgi:hypothetical protein
VHAVWHGAAKFDVWLQSLTASDSLSLGKEQPLPQSLLLRCSPPGERMAQRCSDSMNPRPALTTAHLQPPPLALPRGVVRGSSPRVVSYLCAYCTMIILLPRLPLVLQHGAAASLAIVRPSKL